ncbi:hypothetical protein M758_UG245500 [Ceratodon purpureus]|nr:hypothetical protein M758_UG245500 [Ceratodon purpureus]
MPPFATHLCSILDAHTTVSSHINLLQTRSGFSGSQSYPLSAATGATAPCLFTHNSHHIVVQRSHTQSPPSPATYTAAWTVLLRSLPTLRLHQAGAYLKPATCYEQLSWSLPESTRSAAAAAYLKNITIEALEIVDPPTHNGTSQLSCKFSQPSLSNPHTCPLICNSTFTHHLFEPSSQSVTNQIYKLNSSEWLENLVKEPVLDKCSLLGNNTNLQTPRRNEIALAPHRARSLEALTISRVKGWRRSFFRTEHHHNCIAYLLNGSIHLPAKITVLLSKNNSLPTAPVDRGQSVGRELLPAAHIYLPQLPKLPKLPKGEGIPFKQHHTCGSGPGGARPRQGNQAPVPSHPVSVCTCKGSWEWHREIKLTGPAASKRASRPSPPHFALCSHSVAISGLPPAARHHLLQVKALTALKVPTPPRAHIPTFTVPTTPKASSVLRTHGLPILFSAKQADPQTRRQHKKKGATAAVPEWYRRPPDHLNSRHLRIHALLHQRNPTVTKVFLNTWSRHRFDASSTAHLPDASPAPTGVGDGIHTHLAAAQGRSTVRDPKPHHLVADTRGALTAVLFEHTTDNVFTALSQPIHRCIGGTLKRWRSCLGQGAFRLKDCDVSTVEPLDSD